VSGNKYVKMKKQKCKRRRFFLFQVYFEMQVSFPLLLHVEKVDSCTEQHSP